MVTTQPHPDHPPYATACLELAARTIRGRTGYFRRAAWQYLRVQQLAIGCSS